MQLPNERYKSHMICSFEPPLQTEATVVLERPMTVVAKLRCAATAVVGTTDTGEATPVTS
jgi:hypothetical protein